MSVTDRETTTAGLPREPQGTALPDAASFDVTALRGRRAVQRWERTSFGDVLERLRWSRPDQVVLSAAPGAYGDARFVPYGKRAPPALCVRAPFP